MAENEPTMEELQRVAKERLDESVERARRSEFFTEVKLEESTIREEWLRVSVIPKVCTTEFWVFGTPDICRSWLNGFLTGLQSTTLRR